MQLSRFHTPTLLSQARALGVEVATNGPFLLESKQHELFLSVCLLICRDVDVKASSKLYPYGGFIGYGNSRITNSIFGISKVFRVHAAYHDAFGFMKSTHNKGPGYAYVFAIMPNRCWLGHITGLLYWCYVSFVYKNYFIDIDV